MSADVLPTRRRSHVSALAAAGLGVMAAFLCAPVPTAARVIYVPAELPTIQQAVESAADGDTVLVAPGTYRRLWTKTVTRPTGPVIVNTNVLVDRSVVLVSEAGAEATIIEGAGTGPVAVVSGARGVVIRGFTLRGGSADERVLDGGGGVFCELCEVEISENVIQGNSGPFGAGVACSNAYFVWIHDNLIVGNGPCEFGAGVALLERTECTIEFNVIAENQARVYGGALLINEWSSAAVSRNTIAGNSAAAGSALYCRNGSDVRMSVNIVAGGVRGTAVYCDTLSSGGGCALELFCNDFWQNESGNWEGCADGGANRTIDPLFCAPEAGDYSVCAFSPSLSPVDGCGPRGALPYGCLDCPVGEFRCTWGFLKSIYR